MFGYFLFCFLFAIVVLFMLCFAFVWIVMFCRLLVSFVFGCYSLWNWCFKVVCCAAFGLMLSCSYLDYLLV